MSNQIKHLSPEMAKKFLDREWRLGKSIGILTGLFFLVYCPGIILRKVGIICKYFFSRDLVTYSCISPLIKLYRVSSNTDWPHCKNHKPICNDSMLLFQFGYRSDWSNGLFDPPKTVSRRDQDSYFTCSTYENVYGSEKSMQNYRMEMIMIWFSLFKCRIMNMGKML